MSDRDRCDVVIEEVGHCYICGKVEGPFKFDLGPRCPGCRSVLKRVRQVEKPAVNAILSDTTAADLFGSELR